jgi:hypothetical protein
MAPSDLDVAATMLDEQSCRRRDGTGLIDHRTATRQAQPGSQRAMKAKESSNLGVLYSMIAKKPAPDPRIKSEGKLDRG